MLISSAVRRSSTLATLRPRIAVRSVAVSRFNPSDRNKRRQRTWRPPSASYPPISRKLKQPSKARRRSPTTSVIVMSLTLRTQYDGAVGQPLTADEQTKVESTDQVYGKL